MQRPIRVLHVVSSMNLGGIQTFLMTLYRNTNRNEVQFDFVFHTNERCTFSDEIEYLGGRIFSMPRFNFNSAAQYSKAWKTFFSVHPEYKIIHGHIRSTAAIYLRIAKQHGVFTIAHSHSTFIEKGLIGGIKYLLEYPIRYIADAFFACSKDAAIVLFGKKMAERTTVLKNAIDVDRFVFSSSTREHIRKKFKLNDSLVLGTVGRMVISKNPFFIIDILSFCSKADQSVKLLWVGDGDLLNAVRDYAYKKNMADNIIFTGAQENVEEYLQAMDIFILPSLDEGFGIAAIEAETSGLMTLISDHVPDSACITPITKIFSLSSSAEVWASYILENKIYDRSFNTTTYIRNAGFDIHQVAAELTSYYNGLLQ